MKPVMARMGQSPVTLYPTAPGVSALIHDRRTRPWKDRRIAAWCFWPKRNMRARLRGRRKGDK